MIEFLTIWHAIYLFPNIMLKGHGEKPEDRVIYVTKPCNNRYWFMWKMCTCDNLLTEILGIYVWIGNL